MGGSGTYMEERRTEILNKIIKERLVETCVQYRLNRCKSSYLKEELTQECYSWLCTYDIAKLTDAYENKHLSALITRYLINQFFSKTSDFYKRYKRWDERTDEITDRERAIPDTISSSYD